MSVEQATGGTRKHYGPRTTEDKVPSVIRTASEIFEQVIDFNYDDLPAADEDDALVLKIPANAFIESSHLYIGDDFDSTSGTTTLDVGLQQDDGTEIDNDGLHAADVTADGSNAGWVEGAGALVGAGIGANAGQVVVAPSVSDLTAGSAKLVVRYRKA